MIREMVLKEAEQTLKKLREQHEQEAQGEEIELQEEEELGEVEPAEE